MINSVRSFDKWAWKDVAAHPSDYEDYTLEDWIRLYEDFRENA